MFKKRIVYLSLISIFSFICHMYTYYNYDLTEYQGFRYSHDRDIFIQYSKFNIEQGIIVNDNLGARDYPYNLVTTVPEEWAYPKGITALMSTISMITEYDTLSSMFIVGLFFCFLFVLFTFMLTNILFSSSKAGILSAYFVLLIPTTGTLHGPLSPLPSTLATIFLLCGLYLICRSRKENFALPTLVLCFIVGFCLINTHRPTNTVAWIFASIFLVNYNTRISALFFMGGLYVGLLTLSSTFTSTSLLSLLRLPSFEYFIYLLLLIIFIYLYNIIHKYYVHNSKTQLDYKVSFSFMLFYTPVVAIGFTLLIFLSIFTDYGMAEVANKYKLNIFMPVLLVAGGLYLPSMIFGMLSKSSIISSLSISSLLIGLAGFYVPYLNLGIDFADIERLVAYSLPMATLIYGKYIIDTFRRNNYFANTIVTVFTTLMILMSVVYTYAPYNLQSHDSGISDRDSVISSIYISLSGDDNQAIIIGDIKIVNKMAARMGIENYTFYWDSYPSTNLLMERNIPDYVIYRKYSVINLDDVTYNSTDPIIKEKNLEPHTFLDGKYYYYYNSFENSDIIIYKKQLNV